jgi:F0F1-type ATP synthase assembly protein I
MKIHQTDMHHEILILVIYVLTSPFCFGAIYPGRIYGEGGLMYVVILMITGITSVVSSVLIMLAKSKIKNKILEILIVLVPLMISMITFHLIGGPDADKPLVSTFYFSNTLELVTLYSFSVLYKIIKPKHVD